MIPKSSQVVFVVAHSWLIYTQERQHKSDIWHEAGGKRSILSELERGSLLKKHPASGVLFSLVGSCLSRRTHKIFDKETIWAFRDLVVYLEDFLSYQWCTQDFGIMVARVVLHKISGVSCEKSPNISGT